MSRCHCISCNCNFDQQIIGLTKLPRRAGRAAAAAAAVILGTPPPPNHSCRRAAADDNGTY